MTFVKPKLEPEAVSVDEAVRVSGIGRTSVYALMKTGELPSFRLGKRRLIRLAAIRGLLERLEAEQRDRTA